MIRSPMLAVVSLGLLPLLTAPIQAQTSFPMITHTSPVAIQRGKSAVVTVQGQMNFAGPYKVLVEGKGVTGEYAPPEKPVDPKTVLRAITVKFTAAPDAPLGVYDFRVATELGISSLGQLLVVDDPVIVEAPGINTPAKAQSIPVPCVVSGRTEALENVDYYKVQAKKGEVLTVEVMAARIQDKIHDLQKHIDPLVAIYDTNGKELAANDDYYFADSLLTFPVPADGDYLIQVRDAKYDGDPRWMYALCVTNKPYVAHVFPLAVNPGQALNLQPVGTARLKNPSWPVVAPRESGIHNFSLQDGKQITNPAPLVVSELPLILEQEPNDTTSQANRLPIPGGVNGRIGERRDLDHFVFTGKKGIPVVLKVYARRFGTPLRSALDSALDVMTPEGRVLASNDDAEGKDAAITFTPPSDGDFVVRVRDLNNKGGEDFVYFLEADLAKPDFVLKADPSKAMIGPGSRTAWYVQVTRLNGLTGPVKVSIEGLPPGLTASPLTIPASMTQGVIVLSAAKDATRDASMVHVVGEVETEINGAKAVLRRVATPVEEIYMPGGGRGRFDVGMQAIAITQPSDLLDIRAKPTRITLKPGEEVKIDVEVTRREDYDKPVTLDVRLRHLGGVFGDPLPPGVTMVEGKSKTLLGSGSAGSIVLKAAPNAAEVSDVPICVQGYVPINFVVKLGYSSDVILLSIKK